MKWIEAYSTMYDSVVTNIEYLCDSDNPSLCMGYVESIKMSVLFQEAELDFHYLKG